MGAIMKPRRQRKFYSVGFDPEIIEKLQSIADEQDVSMAHLIRLFVKQGLEDRAAKNPRSKKTFVED
jgi:hypothetical protein